ncbi:MAG: response regulator transcription factor [Rubrivivax sp.]|nr:response regulator transcription factor [Rubrivivax sp.]MDP3083666.1 response regulator transcription factor [Rubrivivax sp.]
MKALLIDDHTLFRDALGLLIGARFPALRLLQAGDLAGGLAELALHPDVRLILLDLNLPDSQSPASIERLREKVPLARLVVLSADDRAETVEHAIELGACGFVPKTARGDTLMQALQVTLDGGDFLPPSALPTAAQPLPRQAASLGLSPRQTDVLRLLIEGLSNKLICRELVLSESTVKTHLAAVFRQLDVNTRTQAVLAAARLGLRFAN